MARTERNWRIESAFMIAPGNIHFYEPPFTTISWSLVPFFFRSMISVSFCGASRWKSVHAFRMSSFIWHVSFIHSSRYIEWSIFVLSSYCLENCCCCSEGKRFSHGNRGISLWGSLGVCFFFWRDNRERFQGSVLVVTQSLWHIFYIFPDNLKF